MSLNPFHVGAVCVVLGALLWAVPSCWFEKPSRAEPQVREPRPAQVLHPEQVAACMRWG